MNLEVMVQLAACFDFLLRKFHLFFYRFHLVVLRFDSNSLMRFFTFAARRVGWNWDTMISKSANYLSRLVGNDVLSVEDWMIIIQSVVYGFLGILLMKYWKLIWRGIVGLIYGMTFPVRFCWSKFWGLFQRRPVELEPSSEPS